MIIHGRILKDKNMRDELYVEEINRVSNRVKVLENLGDV